ncbi:MAG: hypothetical protein NVSMB6_27020 [Burkholderiaceae bacterium]
MMLLPLIPHRVINRVAAVLLACSLPCAAAELPFVAGGVAVPLTSMHQSRVQSTLIQKFDFSCGSAALATLLTYQYGVPVTEQAVFEEMYTRGNQQLIRQQGFSLLDMKSYLARHGFQADGFEQPLDKLATAKLPAIVLISDKGYNHFVVIKGMRDDRVLIGDPASGTRAMTRKSFEKLWTSRLLFVIHNETQLAKFDESIDWRAAPRAPIGTANGEQLRTISLPRFGPGEF